MRAFGIGRPGVLVIAAVSVVLLVGAGVAAATSLRGDANGGVLRVNISESDVQYLDPALDYEFYGWTLLFATCAKLVSYPDAGGAKGSRLVPEVAARMPAVSNGGRTYTFTLRSGFRFSDGTAVTPGSFARAIERALNKKMASPAAGFVSDVVGADAVLAGKRERPSGVVVRGNTISITLKEPAADLLARLAMPFFCAVPEDLPIDPKGVALPPMAGPYYFAAREQGRSVTLQRNPYYGGTRKRHVDLIQVSVNTNTQTSFLQVQKGESDYDIAGPPPIQNSTLAARFGVNKRRYWIHPALAVNYIALNTTRPLTGDVSIRKAINFAIDRQAITNLAGFRAGKPTDQVISPGIPGFVDVSIYPWRPNLAKARALMAGRTGKLTLYVSAGPPLEDQALVIQANLKKIGLDVTIRKFPFAVLLGKVGNPKDPYDMVLIGWYADYADPYDFVNVLLSGDSIGSSNNFALSLMDDPAFNAKMAAAAKLRGAARYAAYARLDEQLMRQAAPWAPVNNPNVREFVSERVGCYTYVPAFQGMSLATACLR